MRSAEQKKDGDEALAHTAIVDPVITGELKNKVDRVWDAFWSGGISNPLEVIEQITYLLFMRRLEQAQLNYENQMNRLGRATVPPVFTDDELDLRWSNIAAQEEAQVAFDLVSSGVFPFLRRLGGDSSYTLHMKDARFTIPTPALLARVIDLVGGIPLSGDTNGDLYEYLLSKLATSGTNGQFRTPRHIIEFMVDLMAPTPTDTICDPACGTAGFLVEASEYLREQHDDLFADAKLREHFNSHMFTGYDFDQTMLRIASMNMLMHGIERADIAYRDSLADNAGQDSSTFSLILANPPFAGSLDASSVSKSLQRVVKTKKTELLFIARFLELLEAGGRAAVIVPDGVLFSGSKAHKDLRRTLVEDQKLDAVIKLPSGVFRPYAGVSTAILCFTKTNSGGTDDVWFYDVRADGFSLDDKRTPIEANDLPDARTRWSERAGTERGRARTEQSFTVPKAEIAEQGYDLSINRYKELVHDEVEHRSPAEIIADLERLDAEIRDGLTAIGHAIS